MSHVSYAVNNVVALSLHTSAATSPLHWRYRLSVLSLWCPLLRLLVMRRVSSRCRATEVICTADDSIAERVMQITEGRGVYGATDAVGGDTLTQVIASLRKGGTGAHC